MAQKDLDMRLPLLAALALLVCGTAQALDASALVAPPPLAADELPALAEDASPPLPVGPPLDEALPWAPPLPRPRGPPALDPPLVAAATAGGVALAIVGFALYSRLARSELLDHARRDALLALIRASPGIALSDVAKRSALAWGTAVYHLERLERAGFVVSERNAGRRCYFVATSVPRDARAGHGTLQQRTTRSVAAFVAARPGATQTELCEGLGLTPSAASKQISKLESAGLVRREREWRSVRLHPEDKLASLLVA